VPLVTISALAERGLDKLLGAVLQVYDAWNRRVPTPDLNRWLREATERHAPPRLQGPPHQDPLHGAGLDTAADLRGIRLAAQGTAKGLRALSHKRHPGNV